MTNKLPLAVRTAYADLLDRAAAAAFDADFDEGNFVSKQIKSRRYWYFETKNAEGYQQKYVGGETPELLERIRQHKHIRGGERDRQRLVSSLLRSHSLPRPQPEVGDVVAALSKSGVFRLNAVLVGTVAYQCYPAMLGVRLPVSTIQTGDVDIARAKRLSVAVNDQTPPMLEVLRRVDRSFRARPHLRRQRVTSYAAASGLRVDFLTPNDGPDTDEPQRLPALQTDAQPLRFLNFLIEDPMPSVMLHDAGVFVLVPAPQRFALHKLIVARRRGQASGKRDKDIAQAEALLEILADDTVAELKDAWDDCWRRGKKWQVLLGEGLTMIGVRARDNTLQAAGATRAVIPGLTLKFGSSAARHDFDSDTVYMLAYVGDEIVRCAISRAALDDNFKPQAKDSEGRLRIVREHRDLIERMMRVKYLQFPIEQAGSVLITTHEFQELRRLAAKLR